MKQQNINGMRVRFMQLKYNEHARMAVSLIQKLPILEVYLTCLAADIFCAITTMLF